MGKNAIGGDDNATSKRSVGSAVNTKTSVGKDQMDGNMSSSKETPYLKMSEGNILEAKGRDVSNNAADVDGGGWGGPDAPYKGMATDTPYGSMGGGKK